MLRDIFTNKWILGSFGVLLLVGAGCVFWYHYTLAPYRQQAAKTQQLAHEWQLSQQVEAQDENHAPADADVPKTVDPSPVTETRHKSTAEVVDKTAPKTLTEIAATLDMPVSPFGLGPYPEVPADFPVQPFDWDFWGETLNDELMSRVQIKLWKQGIKVEGASFRNGKVYPNILGTVYVRWDANRERIRGISGHPDDDFDAIEAGHPPPAGITVLDFYDAGIDPYTFLELNK